MREAGEVGPTPGANLADCGEGFDLYPENSGATGAPQKGGSMIRFVL